MICSSLRQGTPVVPPCLLHGRDCGTSPQTKQQFLLPAEFLARHNKALLDCDAEGAVGLVAKDTVTEEALFSFSVHAYRHLGGILASDTNPMPDLLCRYSHSIGVVRSAAPPQALRASQAGDPRNLDLVMSFVIFYL